MVICKTTWSPSCTGRPYSIYEIEIWPAKTSPPIHTPAKLWLFVDGRVLCNHRNMAQKYAFWGNFEWGNDFEQSGKDCAGWVIRTSQTPEALPNQFIHNALRHINAAESPNPPRGPKPASLGAIIGQFKSRATRSLWKIPNLHDTPIWQRNYYEHVIRDETDLKNKSDYIEANPSLWNEDDENPANIKP